MKKFYNSSIAVFLILSLFSMNIAFAQDGGDSKSKKSGERDRYRWEVGLNGGVNLTNVSGFDHNNIESRFGQLYGMTLIYHFSRVVSLKTDIDFENKGWVLNNYSFQVEDGANSFQTITENVNQNLDYFDVPAFLHIGFGRKFKFDLNFGSYFAVLVQNRAYYLDQGGKEVEVVIDELSRYKDFDFGLTYGGGIDYALSDRLTFGFDLLYEQGLISLQEGSDIRNQSLDFDFGVNFLFRKKKRGKK